MSQRILLVEDDPDLRMLLRVILQRDGFEVEEAEDGQEAVNLLQTETYDGIVTDIAMPRLDGAAAIDIFQSMPRGGTIPIIVITAVADSYIRERLEQAGVAEILEKPCPPDDLLQALRRHLKPEAE